MRKRRKLLLIFGCAALALVLLFALTREHEPTAHGKPLSYWVQIYSGPAIARPATTPQAMAEADAAIKQIGTNAIPFLIEWMDYEPPRWKLRLLMKTGKLPYWIIKSRPVKWFFAAPGFARATEAALSFRALGPTAAPAIPELEIRAQGNSQQTRSCALFALSNIGPTAAPAVARVLTNLLSNPQSLTDPFVGHCIVTLGPNARPLLPILVQYLDHTNASFAIASAGTLGNLRSEPDLAIPPLMRKLGDPRPAVSKQIAFALANLGPQALAQLTNALSDSDPIVRQAATNALAIIKAPRSPPPPSSPFE